MLHALKTKMMLIFFVITIFINAIFFPQMIFAKDSIKNTQEKNISYGENNSNNTNIVSLYCWDIGDFNLSKLKDEIEYLKVNTLYIQRPSNVLQKDRLVQIMEFAKNYKLDVFLLEGARDWLTTGNINNVTALIDEAVEINKTLDYKLKGVSLDVEFYLTDDYQNSGEERQLELFRIFTSNTKKCCDYANKFGLGYSMALPVWLDKLAGEELEELINYNYDHIAFMNYYKETIMENLDEEVEYAKKNNIKIVSIAEVQDPRNGNVGEEDTFYNDGLQECINTLNKIKQKYNYENLGISYHYYKPLLELLERDTDVEIENKYEIEVYPYINGKSVKVSEARISDTENKLQPVYGYYSESKENIINFYGLEYGKEYTLTVKSHNAIGVTTFLYQKDDEKLGNQEIIYMNIDLKENSPEQIEPEQTEPEQTEPEQTEPEQTEPEQTEPEQTEPEQTEPEQTEPEQTEPEQTEPEQTEPEQTEPEQTELKQKKTEKNKDTTVATALELPQTGKNNYISTLLLIGILISVIQICMLVLTNRKK